MNLKTGGASAPLATSLSIPLNDVLEIGWPWTVQGRRKHLRVGQAQSRRAQFINIHCITSFYELSVDDGKIAFFSQKIFWEKQKKGWDETLVPAS